MSIMFLGNIDIFPTFTCFNEKGREFAGHFMQFYMKEHLMNMHDILQFEQKLFAHFIKYSKQWLCFKMRRATSF